VHLDDADCDQFSFLGLTVTGWRDGPLSSLRTTWLQWIEMMMQGTVAMADYYSLISRAVAALETNTFEARRVIYNYARAAQSEQLHNRPFNKNDFDHERLMLEDAISRVEIEVTGGRIATGPSPGTRVRPSNIATSLPPVDEDKRRKGATVIAQAIRKTISALQKCLLLVRRFRLWRHTIWQILFRRGEGFAEPCACAVKHPAISDFHTIVAKAGVSITFKPTNSTYIYRLTDTNDIALAGVEHAGRGAGDYPAGEVQDMAQQIATEHALVHFGQFPDETGSTHAR
jgi:hypothetical protein